MEREVPQIRYPQLVRLSACIVFAVSTMTLVLVLSAPPSRTLHVLITLCVSCSMGLAVLVLIQRNRSRYSLSQVSHQLTTLAQQGTVPPTEIDISRVKPVKTNDAVGIGWTRLANHLAANSIREKFDQRESELQQQSTADVEVLHSLGDGIGVTDIEGRLIFLNNAMTALLGTDSDQDDFLSQSLPELLPEDLPGNIVDALDGQQPVSFDTTNQTTDSLIQLRWSRRPKYDDVGNLQGHVWTARDVTQQQLAEDMREQFVSMATHELRTPLTNITAYAETLSMADDIDVEQQKEFYNIIQSEATRLSRFVDELLNISRMEAGSMTLDCRETDLERLVNEVSDKVRPEVNRKKLSFKISFPPKLPKLTVDKDKLAAALVNLIGNAVKYTPEDGNVTFTVKAVADEVVFEVQDTGFGIAESEIPKLFDKFFRSDDSRVRDVTGSGLGLSFTSEVARLHNGRIDVVSELNEGSTFSLVLPLQKGAQA